MVRPEVLETRCRSEWEHLIDEWIFDERDRYMLKRQLLDGKTISQIAEEVEMSNQQVHARLKKAKQRLFAKLD